MSKRIHAQWTPLAYALADNDNADRLPCAQCGGPVEQTREVYAVPTCHTCLPPPTALPLLTVAPK